MIYYKNGIMHCVEELIPIFVSRIERNLWRISFPNGQEPSEYKRKGILVRGKKRHVMLKIHEWWDEHSSKQCICKTPIEWETWIEPEYPNKNWDDWQRRLNDDEAFQDWLRRSENL